MNTLFQNKTKHIVAVSFAALLIAVSIWEFDFSIFSYAAEEGSWRYMLNTLFVPLIKWVAPVSVIVYFFTMNKDYRLKRWLLPLAFGIHWCTHQVLLMVSFSSIIPHFESFVTASFYNVSLLLTTGAAFIANTLIFIGFLLNDNPIWVRVGSLLYVVPMIFSYIVGFVNAGGLSYYQAYWETMSASFIQSLVSFVSSLLFYIGLFILSTNKAKAPEQ